jgi:putative YhdH/YhfP family quinone oxidoreductase
MGDTFKAVVVEEIDGKFVVDVKERLISSLPEGDVLINVKYSSLNYKDALSCTGNKGVTKNYPHTPGIDAAGIVVESANDQFKKGDEVIVFGYDLGMNHSGGFSQYIRVPHNWVIKKPDNITLKELMIYGTAGFTAALSVDKLMQYGLKKEDGDIVVTGATGGVGIISIAILSKLGFNVYGVTGKKDKENFLKMCGAKGIVPREEVDDTSGKVLLKPKWAGGVDAVGGNILSTIIRSIKHSGAVAVCGLAQSPKLDLTVYPLILRGVSVLGIDSVELPIQKKQMIVNKVATDYKIDILNKIHTEIALNDIKEIVPKMLKAEVTGRYLVRID